MEPGEVCYCQAVFAQTLAQVHRFLYREELRFPVDAGGAQDRAHGGGIALAAVSGTEDQWAVFALVCPVLSLFADKRPGAGGMLEPMGEPPGHTQKAGSAIQGDLRGFCHQRPVARKGHG